MGIACIGILHIQNTCLSFVLHRLQEFDSCPPISIVPYVCTTKWPSPAHIGESHLRHSLWTSARPSSTSCAKSSTCSLQLRRQLPLPNYCLHRTLTRHHLHLPWSSSLWLVTPYDTHLLHILPCPAVQAQRPRDTSR